MKTMCENKIESRLNNCNFVKTILMFIIVIYHSILFWGGNWFVEKPVFNSEILKILSLYLNSFHIYCFTLVSGYIYYYLKIEKHKYDKLNEFVKTKVKRLIVPYIFVAAVYVIPISVYFFNYGIGDIFKKYVLAIAPNQLWFLIMLFDVFIIMHFIAKICDNKPILGGIICLFFFCVSVIGSMFLPNVFMIWTSCKYVSFFYIGFLLRKYPEMFLWKVPGIIYFIIHLFLFFIVNHIEDISGIVFKFMNLGLSYLLNLFGAVMIFMLLQKLAFIIDWKKRFFNFISENSMVIYLFHQQLIYFTIICFNGVVNPYINSLINFVFSFSISIIIAVVLKRFSVTKFLIGEK